MSTSEPSDPTTRSRHVRVKHSARAHFDQWAASYDRSVFNELVFFPSMRACREEIIRWKRRRGLRPYRLLDVGCGTGRLITMLAEDADAVGLVGLDYSPQMVRRVAAKIDGLDENSRLRVVHGDAEHLPFEEASFDVVTCCHSFHHYPHQPAVVRGFHRVLRPGGLLIVIDGFRDNAIGWFVFDICVALAESHVHHAPWSVLRRMIEDAGFSELRQRKLNVLAPLLVNLALR